MVFLSNYCHALKEELLTVFLHVYFGMLCDVEFLFLFNHFLTMEKKYLSKLTS